MTVITFNYDAKIWGAPKVRLKPTYMQALKLRYCLQDLESVSGRVLDIGCGAGNMPKAIKHYRPDLEVWGADLSLGAIRAAVQDSNGSKFIPATGENLPFPDDHFDAVTMFDVLEHFAEPKMTLREIRRVLRPTGLFHLFLPLEKQPWTIYAPLYHLGWKAKEEYCGHVQFYSDHECTLQLRVAGFEVRTKRWSIHPFYALVDVAYFTFLQVRGKPVSTSVEGYVAGHEGGPTLAQRTIGLLKDLLVTIGHYESLALYWMPAGGGHFTAIPESSGQ